MEIHPYYNPISYEKPSLIRQADSYIFNAFACFLYFKKQ